MPSIDVASKDEAGTMSGPLIGIIYPPPEVRNIVDKTASFVARNGAEFEARIRANELGNPKFNFLNPGDPYHAYYTHRVQSIQDGKAVETPATPQIPKAPSSQVHAKQQELLKQVAEKPFVPKDPPPEYEFIADPPSISALDLDIVKLTAQFVARNGRTFLTNLMNREQRNYQFDFLRPQHSLFVYFTVLLKQYTKVLLPPKDVLFRLKDEADSMGKILDQVKYRSEWQKFQDQQRAKEEEALEKERVAYAQIDWHDFVVVETVDYQPNEPGNFPPPTTPEEVGARVIMQERIEEVGERDDAEMMVESDGEGEGISEDDIALSHMQDLTVHSSARDDNQVQDMEEESSDEEDNVMRPPRPVSRQTPIIMRPAKVPTAGSIPQALPLPPSADKVVVRKGYDPKLAKQKPTSLPADEFLISPITGETIPAAKVQEHMRIGLLDPRWVEQRDKLIQDKLNQDTVYAPGAAIEASLKQLAERRTDIFGIGDEETAIGKKIGEEDRRKDEKVTWDGHTSSVEAATRAARANITLEDQIHQIHKVKGLLPDEEKEKIGPKPVVMRGGTIPAGAGAMTSAGVATAAAAMAKAVAVEKKAMAAAAAAAGVVAKAPPVPKMPTMGVISAPPMAATPAGMPPGMAAMMMPVRPVIGFPVPNPLAASYMTAGMDPSLMKHPIQIEEEDSPAAKKPRTEDNLIPEQEFLSRQKNSTVVVKVHVPQSMEKPEWKLNGQILSLALPLTDTVAVVKSKVHDETGMPPTKQKLLFDNMFLKDSNSLAFYNVVPGAVILLQIKERGGRGKK